VPRYHVHGERVVAEEADDVVTPFLHLNAHLDQAPGRQMDTMLWIHRVRLDQPFFLRRRLLIAIIHTPISAMLLSYVYMMFYCIVRLWSDNLYIKAIYDFDLLEKVKEESVNGVLISLT